MKQRIAYLLKFYVVTLAVFLIAKVIFMVFNRDEGVFGLGDVPMVLWHGLTLDLSTALYFLIVPLLVVLTSLWVRCPGWLIKAYYAVIAIAFALAFVTDTSMYPFWHFKLDASWLQYLESPTEAMASVTTGYLLVRLVLVVIVAILIYIVYPRISHLAPRTTNKIASSVLCLLLVPLMVIGIRGGLGESTTNIGQVYYSQNQFLNHSAVNPVFSFFYSMAHQLEDFDQYQFLEPVECVALTAGVYTTESLHSDTLLNTERPNILIILLESAGEQFAAAMPHLQELKKEGICFSRCYANSWRTDRGTLCTLSGYPSFPGLSVMKIPEKSRKMPSIAKTLKQEGYASSFLYGGDINFTNMRSYLFSTGWDSLMSKDDYSLSEQHTGQWGVRDDITFATLFSKIVSVPVNERHLWGYSTLSSHEPWDVPVRKLDDEVDNAFCYLDDCLYDFIGKLRQTPQWENLLVILVADHGIVNKQIDQMKPLQKNHIPMLWLGGAVRQPRKIDVLCNQSDLSATLLGQLHLNHDEYTFSRDVLSETYTAPTVVHNYNNVQWICDSTGHVLYDFDLQRLVINESSDAERLLRLDKAIIQLTTADLKNK